jgi:hypothetical protein
MAETPAPFTRSDLARLQEQGGQFRELRDVKWINPREFHRKALADIEDLGYAVARGSSEAIKIEREAIGEKTGHVESWIAGSKDLTTTAAFPWNPYSQFGLVLVVVGVLLGVVGMPVIAGAPGPGVIMLLLGGGMLAGGIMLLRYRKSEQFLIHGILTIKLLAVGEATERTVQRPGANVTDLFAQLSVSYAFIQHLEINEDELPNPAFRIELQKFVASKIRAFPQLNDVVKGNPTPTYMQWPYRIAPFAEFLTSDANKLLLDQAKLVGPDFAHLTTNIERYGTSIEARDNTIHPTITAPTEGRA